MQSHGNCPGRRANKASDPADHPDDAARASDLPIESPRGTDMRRRGSSLRAGMLGYSPARAARPIQPVPQSISPFGQLAALCDNATVALFALDARQHCIYMNHAAEALTGFALADVVDAPLHEFIHHTHPDGTPFPIADCPIDRAAPTNAREQGQGTFIHRDGSFYPVAFTASPMRYDDGATGTVIEVRSIAAEREAEAEQEAIRQLAEVLLREVDLDTIVQRVTDAATQLCGAQFGAFFYNVTDAAGERFTLYTISGVDKAHFSKFPMPRATPLFKPTFDGKPTVLIADVLKDERYGHWAPHRGMPEGHLPVRSYLATPVAADDGEVLGGLFFGHSEPDQFNPHHVNLLESIAAQAALGVSRATLFSAAQRARERAETEAREKERLYQEATRANEMKDLFLATVSHELRTPLTSILGWSDMLASGRLPADRLQVAVATIARNARAQAQIVDDLLDVSRIISGKLQLTLGTLSPSKIVEVAVESVRPTAAARGIQLVSRVSDSLPPVSGDVDRLQQVLWNLLANALKFTDAGGAVSVEAEQAESQIEIRVIDDGRGIEAAFVPYLFDTFTQSDPSTRREHGGLGLGLAIVRQLVELHGGTVTACSDGLGKGSTFTVRLPVCAVRRELLGPLTVPGADSQESGSDATLPDLSAVRVLLVEDDADSRDLLANVLRSAEAEVWVCSNAGEALGTLEQAIPDIIVSDIGMPGMDGYDLIRSVRARSATSGVPAIALSAYAQASDRMRALKSGFQTHVAKPLQPAELLAVVASLTSLRSAGHVVL